MPGLKLLIVGLLMVAILAVGGVACNDSGGTTPGPNGNGDHIQPPPTQASWHIVTTFSGKANKTTDLFDVAGDKFRITWTVVPDAEAVEFGFGGDLYILVYPEGETLFFVEDVMSTGNMTTASDSTIVYKGPGKFYLDVSAANVESWKAKIDAYY